MKLPKRRSGKKLFTSLAVLSLMVVGGWLFVSGNPEEPAPPVTQTENQSADAASQPDQFKQVSEQPVRIVIDKIGVDASIEPVGLTADGMMDAPDTNEMVGWYNKSAKAGDDNFSMLLDGHYGTESYPAVFWRLAELENGDNIQVQGKGGSLLKYKVVEIQQQYTEDVDMEKALYPYSDDVQSLTIITCDGEYDPENVTYDKRTVLYAERVA